MDKKREGKTKLRRRDYISQTFLEYPMKVRILVTKRRNRAIEKWKI